MQFTKEHYNIIRYGLGFLFFCGFALFIIEKSLAFCVANSNDSQTGKINLVMAHQIDPEVLFLGSSVAEVGFNANLIGQLTNKTVYNLAIDGTSIIQSRFLIDEFLSYSQNCKRVVIGFAFFSFDKKTSLTEPSRYLAHFSNTHVKSNFRQIDPELYSKLRYVPFYSFTQTKHTYYKNAVHGLKNIIKGNKLVPDILNGYVPHNTPWNGERVEPEQIGSETISISPETIKRVIDIINNIKAKNIEPVLVITPMYLKGQELFSNFNHYQNAAKEISEKTGVKLFDFSNSELVLDEKNFYNNGHLNSTGADLFSKMVADSLISIVSIR